MWSRFSRSILVTLLVELLLIEPPLQAATIPPGSPGAISETVQAARELLLTDTREHPVRPAPSRADRVARLLSAVRTARALLLAQAGGFDSGIAVGSDLLNSFGTTDALQQNQNAYIPKVIPRDPTCGTDIDCITQRSLDNPYYTQNPDDSNRRNLLSRDIVTETQISPLAEAIQQRAISPYKWSFGAHSGFVASMQNLVSPDLTINNGCYTVQVCTQPTSVTTQQQCEITQTFEQVTCAETYAIAPDPNGLGGQTPVLTDGCTEYKTSPWFPLATVCMDPPGTERCQPYQDIKEVTSCIDHWLDVGLKQEGDTIVVQKWDAKPGSHSNCGADYVELDRIPVRAFGDDPVSVTITATGDCSGTATVTPGQRVRLFSCGKPYHETNVIRWTSWLEKCLDCWNTQRTFGKEITLSSTCGPLEEQGCIPSGQECLTDDCSQARKIYSCSTPGECVEWKPQLVCSACFPDPPSPPRCVDDTYPPNSDFGIAAAAMEGQVTMAKDKDGEPKFFVGTDERCKDTFLVDCCGSGDATADNIRMAIDAAMDAYTAIDTAMEIYNNFEQVMEALSMLSQLSSMMEGIETLTTMLMPNPTLFVVTMVVKIVIEILLQFLSCKPPDIEASTKKGLRVCQKVGRYCSVKALICLEHKTSYCCFSTVLARIIQQQARAQLGIGWGQDDDPDCRGLTATELQTIDWTKIDLTEYLVDLQHRMRWPDPTTTESAQDNVSNASYQDSADAIVANSGSLGRAVQAAIAPPGGWDAVSATTVPITLNILGSGRVDASPIAKSCSGSCTLRVPPNQPITLTVTADATFAFAGWTGNCSGTGPCTITPTGPLSVTATFTTTQIALSLSMIGKGTVTITVSDEDGGALPPLSCTSTLTAACSFPLPAGATVTLTATPGDNAWTFDTWTGACTGAAPCILTMSVSRSVIARFNGTPVITSLLPNVTFPVPAGTVMTWTTTTIGGTPPIEYRYIRTDGSTQLLVQDWSTSASYTWATTPADAGTHAVTVLVRNSGSPAEFEDIRDSPSFTILQPLSVSSVAPSSAPRGTTTTLTLTGTGFRSGDIIMFTSGGSTVPGITVTTVVPLSDTQLAVTIIIDPATPIGPTDVTVADPDGPMATLPNSFTVTL